jgi:outer membrane protein TolC
MKQSLLVIFLFLKLQLVFGQLTIDSCQSKARANYPLIKQYDLINKTTEYTVSNANKGYLPQISLTGIGGYIINGLPAASLPGQAAPEPDKFQLIGIAQLHQTIWDGGATGVQKDIANANAEVDKANIDVSFYSIRERVNQLYFGILIIDEQLKQLEILNENLERSLEKVKLSKENGLAYQSDVDEVKVEVLNLQQKKIEFNYTRKGYIEMLSYLVGEKLNEDVKLEKPVVIESISSLSNNRPELGLYASQMKLIEAQSAINKVSNMPKIGLLGAGVWIDPGANLGAQKLTSLAIAGLSLSWSSAGLFKNSNNKNLDKIRIARIANQQETFSFTNNLQLTQTSSEIEKQKAIIKQDDEIVKLKGDIKKSYQLRYDNGMAAMNDLVNAINKESEALSNRALHNVQLLMSMYNYKTISGN